MSRLFSKHTIAALLLAFAIASAAADAPTALTSTKDRGVVSLQPDPMLSYGRLVLKVVAFNRTRDIASFGTEDVEIYTAAGQRVGLITLDQLVAEARGARPAERSRGVEHNPSHYGGPEIRTNSSGQPSVDSYTGSQAPVGGVISPHTNTAAAARDGGKEDPAVEQQVSALQAAILHPVTIASGSAEGGQIVTEKLKFRRKDDRTLRVVVEFNGEKHEFSVPTPAE